MLRKKKGRMKLNEGNAEFLSLSSDGPLFFFSPSSLGILMIKGKKRAILCCFSFLFYFFLVFFLFLSLSDPCSTCETLSTMHVRACARACICVWGGARLRHLVPVR